MNLKYDAVLEGGGCKIPGLIGALYGIESQGFTPSHLAGTSAGAIVAAARAAGYDPEELKDILIKTNFQDFLDNGRFFSSKAWSVFRHKGMYKGDYFYNWIKDLLSSKGVKTFGDLRDLEETSIQYKWKLKVFAADISSERLITLPDDASLFDIEPDDFEVALAVRMSMSIPFFFRPIKIGSHFIVDGGLISNFPIWTFDSYDKIPDWPTFGLLLEEDGGSFISEPKDIGFWPHDMFLAMFRTMMKANDRRFIRADDFEHRTIKIDTLGVSTLDFNLSAQKKEELFHSGNRATQNFFTDWSFEEYQAWAKKIRRLT